MNGAIRAARSASRRVPELDGLRGVAALVVLFHHALLASSPWLAKASENPTSTPLANSTPPDWLITYTPLHVFWAGSEAVVVFFVLSGYVLALQFSGARRQRIAAYYPSRMLRLYLPVWGALPLAAALHVVVSHTELDGASWWLNGHAVPLTLGSLVSDAGLMSAHSGDWGYLTVLWSLHWEVIFSAALPLLMLLLPLRWRVVRVAIIAGCFVSLVYGQNDPTYNLPPFVLGMMLAAEHEGVMRFAGWMRRFTPLRTLIKLALGGACIALLTAAWWTGISDGRQLAGLVGLGALLAPLAALAIPVVAAVLRSAPMQWTGKRAFSLYLVHEPLLVALAFTLRGRVSPAVLLVLGVPASIALCEIFYRLVEEPSHRLARAAGRGSERAFGAVFGWLRLPWNWRRLGREYE